MPARTTVNRSFGRKPIELGEEQTLAGKGRMRPAPSAALPDLHLSHRSRRRVNNDHSIDFDGQNYEISATLPKSVTLVHHPDRQIWIVEHPPKDVWPEWH